jgi:NADH-quinone oxidoreductase subunit H
VLLTGSLSLQEIIKAQRVPHGALVPMAALIYFLAMVAELGRLPFELAEADSEIVAGYFTEYSGMMFGAFYLAEFINNLTASVVFSVLFLGGWRGPWVDQLPLLGAFWLLLKAFLVFNVLVLFWAAMPRLRIDQVLAFNWKFLTPLGLLTLIVVALADKLLATAGIVDPWGRAVGLVGANVLLGAVAAVFLSTTGRWLKRRDAGTGSIPACVSVGEGQR